MKLGGILKKVGGAVLSSVVPGGGLILDVVNELLPSDKKLNKSATGTDIQAAIDTLPPEQRNKLLEKELDVEITEIKEWSNVIESLAKADASGSSTRPQISLMMAKTVSFAIILFISVWVVAIFRNQEETLKQLHEAWPLMLTVLATPTALLRAYFGMRSNEKKSRYEMANGVQGKGNVITNIISAFRGK
jgi:hypothetical protein